MSKTMKRPIAFIMTLCMIMAMGITGWAWEVDDGSSATTETNVVLDAIGLGTGAHATISGIGTTGAAVTDGSIVYSGDDDTTADAITIYAGTSGSGFYYWDIEDDGTNLYTHFSTGSATLTLNDVSSEGAITVTAIWNTLVTLDDLAQVGGAHNSANSTCIAITLNTPVADLETSHFSITGASISGSGVLATSGTGVYLLPIRDILVGNGVAGGIGVRLTSVPSGYQITGSGVLSVAILRDATHQVTYNVNGGSSVSADGNHYSSGQAVTVGGNSSKTGYIFVGWDNGSGTSYKAGDTFTMGSANVTLTAKWEADGSYNPGGLVPNSSSSNPVNRMADVNPSASGSTVATKHWAYDAINFALKHHYMNGISNTEFAPDQKVSRAMVAQVFGNMSNFFANGYKDSPYSDVKISAWYGPAAAWAESTGVMTGVSNGKFAPDRNVTREELAVAFYNYAKYKGLDTTVTGSLSKFKDSGKVASWAKDALVWANSKGIINGRDTGNLDPKATATRAELASILYKFDDVK